MNTAGILAILTLLSFAIYILYGIVLSYHWIRFSASRTITTFSLTAYAVAGIYLLGLMLAAVAAL